MRFHYTSILRLWNLAGCIDPCYSFLRAGRAFCLLLTRHSCFHMHLQLSPRIPNSSFEFFIFRINKVSKCLSFVEHYRVLAFRLPIIVFPSFERPPPILVHTFGHNSNSELMGLCPGSLRCNSSTYRFFPRHITSQEVRFCVVQFQRCQEIV